VRGDTAAIVHAWRLVRRSSAVPVLAAALLFQVAPARAGASLVLPDGTPAAEEQAWLEQALAPSPPTVVTVYRERCPGTDGRACAMVDAPEIYVAGDDGWPWDQANTRQDALLHEVGHMLDRPWTGFPDSARDEFRALIGDDRPWRTEPNSPHEKFAEAWRLCALGVGQRPGEEVSGGYDYRPSPEVHREVCALIARAGAALGWTAGSHPPPAPPPAVPPVLVPAAPIVAAGTARAAHRADSDGSGVLGTRTAGRLTAGAARAAVRAAVRRRVAGAAGVRVICRRQAPHRLRCRFAARHGRRSYEGRGVVAAGAADGRVGYRLSVTVSGPRAARRTVWSG
jgi:hypothetical protein